MEIISFFSFYLAGLALNLTPCVYPMISVTVALFGAGQGERRVLRATLYVLGMATMYSALGASAALTGGLFGAWLANKWVLAGLGSVMVVLAFGMFGLYQFQLPAGILARISTSRGTGLFGIFLAGLLVGVFAAPCIGPPVAALLALVAAKQDPIYGFSAFFVLALGLGTPYWLLGVFSGLVKKLPRSGAWLVWVERFFGVLLLAVSVYFFMLAFGPKQFSGGLAWEPYEASKLEAYRKSGAPVALDFFAEWCAPCHEMDRVTFSEKKVIEALQPFHKLRVDMTQNAPPVTREFQVVGIPTIVFFNRKGDEVETARVVGFVPPEKFLKNLKKIE